jgi:arylformamidase
MTPSIRRVHDISLALGVEDPTWPGDPGASVERVVEFGDKPCRLSTLSMCLHNGTHLDAPAHFLEDGAMIDAMPPERFVLPARVVDATGRPDVDGDAVDAAGDVSGRAVLFRTDNSTSGRCRSGVFDPDFVALTPDAARACVEAGAVLVGLDYQSVGPPGPDGVAVHRALLGAGIWLLEGVDLDGVGQGDCTLICPPLKLPSAEGSPVRALLVEWG